MSSKGIFMSLRFILMLGLLGCFVIVTGCSDSDSVSPPQDEPGINEPVSIDDVDPDDNMQTSFVDNPLDDEENDHEVTGYSGGGVDVVDADTESDTPASE